MPTIPELEAQEALLILSRFDADTALTLGLSLVAIARARTLPVLIDIRSPAHTYFRAMLPGADALNDRWARRKSNAVFLFGASSLLVGARLRAQGKTLADQGCNLDEFADHGGGFPLRVPGAGIVAALTISGLPQLDDHALAVEALTPLTAAA
jgi:uncharacterized protein (UPF0303 family)